MAQKVTIFLVDDLDGTEASETVAFALDGTNYEIDLNTKNAKALRSALAAYVAVGRSSRKANGSLKARQPSKPEKSVPPASDIREWAKKKRIKVPPKGRIPNEVRERYVSEAL